MQTQVIQNYRLSDKVKIFTVSALALALGACSSIPPKQTALPTPNPSLDLNQNFEVYDETTDSDPAQTSTASQRWQDFYSDKKLTSLIALGLEHNRSLQDTILTVQKVRANYRITQISNVPKIGSSGSVGFGGDLDGATNDENYNVGLSTSYEIDFWGKIASQKEGALQQYLATVAGANMAQISLISEIANAYVNLSYEMALLKLAQETEKNRLHALKLNKKRFEAGLDDKTPFLQAEASHKQAELSIVKTQANILTLKNALQELIGQPVPDSLLPDPAVRQITKTKVFQAGLPSQLLLYRPDLQQAERNLQSANANIKVARAAFFPTIELSGSLGFGSTSLSDLFSNGIWSFVPKISLPIFDAGNRKINYEVREIEQKSALNAYEQAIQKAFKEVSNTLINRANIRQQLTTEESLQKNYDETYNISYARFKAGLANYLNVLTAENTQFNNQNTILNLRRNDLLNQIELYKVLGGGATPLPEPSKPAKPETKTEDQKAENPEDTKPSTDQTQTDNKAETANPATEAKSSETPANTETVKTTDQTENTNSAAENQKTTKQAEQGE